MSIKIEEFKELLNNEDTKTEVISLLNDMGFESSDSVEGLKNKRTELLGKNKALKNKLSEYEERLAELEELSAGDNSEKEDQKINREIAQLQKQLEKVMQEKQSIESNYTNIIKQNTVSKALKDAKIDSKHFEILESALQSKISLEDGQAFIEDTPINEYLSEKVKKDWSVYVEKPVNNGGSINVKPSKNSVLTRSEFNELQPKDQVKYVSDGGVVTD